MITVAITTFNRCAIVGRAVRMALRFCAVVQGTVVVVDDASTDETEALIAREFQSSLSDGTLSYFRHKANLGVTAAKNFAFLQSPAGWVLFLDSDDELIEESAPEVARVLANQQVKPLVFFRCVDQTGAFVGRRFTEPQRLSLQRYASHTSYGEALVAINKAVSPDAPFDPDLRGYEGLGCARLIHRFGPALLSTTIARRYDRTGNDRLSGFAGTVKRAGLLARGHLRYLSLYKSNIRLSTRFSLRIKALVYNLLGFLGSTLWFRDGKNR